MNVLDKILEEIDNRKSYHEEKLYQQDDYEIQKMYCNEELDWITNIVRSHMDDSLSNEKCSGNNHAFVVKDMTAEQFKDLTKNKNSFQKVMERFNRNKGCMVYGVDSNTKCSDYSRREWYQIGYRDGKNEVENAGWIPVVEERLPEEKVLAQDKYGEMLIGYIAYDSDMEWFECEDEGVYLTNVVAWQPLPKKYEPLDK